METHILGHNAQHIITTMNFQQLIVQFNLSQSIKLNIQPIKFVPHHHFCKVFWLQKKLWLQKVGPLFVYLFSISLLLHLPLVKLCNILGLWGFHSIHASSSQWFHKLHCNSWFLFYISSSKQFHFVKFLHLQHGDK
jgi:hypothetical protein